MPIKTNLYDLKIKKREGLPGNRSFSSDGGASSVPQKPNEITIAEMLENVKDNDGNPYLTGQNATQTRQFKHFFGDWTNPNAKTGSVSVVRDKDGKPLVVYHGTNADFAEYLGSKITNTSEGIGFYFSPDKEMSASFGSNVVAAYLNLRNPVMPYSQLDFEEFDVDSPEDAFRKVIAKLEAQGYEFYGEVDRLISNYADKRACGYGWATRKSPTCPLRKQFKNNTNSTKNQNR